MKLQAHAGHLKSLINFFLEILLRGESKQIMQQTKIVPHDTSQRFQPLKYSHLK